MGGVVYRVKLVEAHIASIQFVEGHIVWPKIDEAVDELPIDGVLCLYDVGDQESLEGLPELIAALDATATATCLVSNKVEIPLCDYAVPYDLPDRVRAKFSIVTGESAYTSPDSSKRCLLKLLKEVLIVRDGQTQSLANGSTIYPPRISSKTSSTTSLASQRAGHGASMHAQSKDNLSAHPEPVMEFTSELEIDTRRDSKSASKSLSRSTSEADIVSKSKPSTIRGPQTPDSSGRRAQTAARTQPNVPATPESMTNVNTSRRDSSATVESTRRTFLDMDDESIYGDVTGSGDELADPAAKLSINDDTSEGSTFDELIDRLLAVLTTRSDQKFPAAFLCLYRTFATPMQLLKSIIERLVKTESSDMVAFSKSTEVLRYLSIIGQWSTHYPGDFADPKVRDMALAFMTTIAENKAYVGAARHIISNLQTVVVDEDEDWAYIEPSPGGRKRSNTSPSKPSIKPSRAGQRDVASDSDDDGLPTPSSPRYSATTSSASSLAKSSLVSSQTSDSLLLLETARSQARKLRAVPHNPINKEIWHKLMLIPNEELATELTRAHWTMYSAIRPRDFVRSVVVPQNQRVKAGSIDYIGMLTKHVNHLVLFVTAMLLVRDKPKHRAKMLEKFMDLAWKVRNMNNYLALGAIVAALSSEAIVRLSQTQELISAEQHKSFLRLKILMGHHRSHAAYRMAWENSSGERIPFPPRIQEDLTKAALGNATFIGKKIKWTKFEVMGETVVSIQRSQEQPYAFSERTSRGHDIARLVLESKVLDGDEVSERHT